MADYPDPMIFGDVLDAYFRDFVSKVTRRVCKDQYVGLVSAEGYIWGTSPKGFSCREEPLRRPPENPPIILILESPHKDEFKPEEPVPANGSTGRNIREYIHVALREKLTDGITRSLILVNAIPYQCSAGVKTESHRSGIFRRMWRKKGVRDSFAKRIQRYVGDERGNALIVNACTRGERTHPNERDLYCLVEDVLFHRFGGSDSSVPHPSNWVPPTGESEPIIEQRQYFPRPGLRWACGSS
ncbi:hypothetical protein [Melittangium boletus]|uniref:hypothetical protein n=1 Tax=Melittangium boletus TaxID=83453 RepID=UPI003DA670EB